MFLVVFLPLRKAKGCLFSVGQSISRGVFPLYLSFVLPPGMSFLVSFQCEEGRLSPSALGIKDAVSFLGVASMGFVLLLLARGSSVTSCYSLPARMGGELSWVSVTSQQV